MKKYALALALFLAPFASAFADGCTPTPAAPFIADGLASIEDGTVKGIAIQGDDAVLVAHEIGITVDVKVFAIFFATNAESELVMLVVFASPDGTEGVCFGVAGDKAQEALRNHMGRRSATNG